MLHVTFHVTKYGTSDLACCRLSGIIERAWFALKGRSAIGSGRDATRTGYVARLALVSREKGFTTRNYHVKQGLRDYLCVQRLAHPN